MSLTMLGISNLVGAVAIASYILQEDGFILLTEAGEFLTQE